MMGGIVAKVAGVVATGAVGAAAYDGVKRMVRGRTVRSAAVTATSWGLRGVRAAEVGAERMRLAAADIVSEARGKLGEQTTPPGAAPPAHHGHVH